MTLNRSSAPVAHPTQDRHPHLRVCPPLEGDTAPAAGSTMTADGTRPPVFTVDELALLSLFADGLCIEAIARRLDLSDRTIRRRSRAMCDRLGVVSTIQVVAWAARRHLI